MKLRVGASIRIGQLIVLSATGNAVPLRKNDKRAPVGVAECYLKRGRFTWTVNGTTSRWTSIDELTQVSISYTPSNFISDKVFPNE